MSSATLILPGLGESRAAWPVRMRRFSVRATCETTTAQGYEDALLQALGYPTAERQVPAARCCFLADFNESATLNCARADPVSLRADRDGAQLVPAELLDLSAEDTRQLLTTLNQHFAEDGLEFTAGRKQRWYVTGHPCQVLDAAPVNQVAGRAVAGFLPVADESSPWRKLASEVQMLLHEHPVNLSRQNRGLLPVNALWFWGAAALPDRAVAQSARLYSDAAYAVGLARLSGVTAFPFAEASASLNKPVVDHKRGSRPLQRNQLIVIDIALLESILTQDADRQHQALTKIDNELLAVAEQALWRGRLNELVINTCDQQQYVLSRGRLCRFWRRPPSLAPSSEDPVSGLRTAARPGDLPPV
ncbi:MAG: hypothetical protein KTR33_09185 [Gammaproteobacteria bacterium]|nr:hypothetical protein [Gammaproteobacteria bacterium]